MNIAGKLINIALSATLCVGLVPAFALGHEGLDCDVQDASIMASEVEGDQSLSSLQDDDALDEPSGIVDRKEESTSVSSPSEDSVEPTAGNDGSTRATAMELSVSHGSLMTGSPSQFTLNVSDPSSDMQYHLDWVDRYDYGVRAAVVDPSRMPAYQTSNILEFEFATSGRYELQFQAMDREPLASGQQVRTAIKRITVDVSGAPSTEQLVQDIVTSCSAAGMTTDYEKALWLHDYIVDHAEYVLKPQNAPNGPGYDFCNAEGVLARGYGTCESYHRAYVMLLNKAGISTGRMEGNGHVWTAVKMDGKWYQVDVTWDDPGYDVPGFDRKRLYFGLTDEIMKIVHPDHVKPVPGYESSSLENNYFIRSGAADSLAAPSVSLIQAKLDAGETDFAITVPNLFTTDAYNDVLFRIVAYKLGIDAWTAKGKKANVSVSYAGGQLHCKADIPIIGDVKITQTDDQKMRGAFSVIVSGLPSTGIAFVEAPTWSEANGQDDLEWYRLTPWQGVWTRELPCLASNRQPGTYLSHIYLTAGNGVRVFAGGVSGKVALAPASVTAKITPNETWFSVSASGGYAAMADAVQFAVWSDAGGQDDLRWYSSTKRGSAWGNDIPVSLHATAGSYQVHAYALKGGQRYFVGGATFRVSAPKGSVRITQTDDQKVRGAFSVTLSAVSSPSGVAFADAPTWSEANGQDDLEWYRLTPWQGVWTRELPCLASNRQPGTYLSHIYLTAGNGVRVFAGGVSGKVALAPASVTAKITPNETWFSVSASGGYAAMADAVQFAVWSDAGGQDDLRWYSSTKRGSAWGNDIPVSLHATAGSYQVHAYALKGGQRYFVGGATFRVSAPKGTVSLLSSAVNSYKVNVTNVVSPSGVSKISNAAWTLFAGQDDLVWHQADNSGTGRWTATIHAMDHMAQAGLYANHVYVTCVNGVQGYIGSCDAQMVVEKCPFVMGSMGSGKRTIGVKWTGHTTEVSIAVWSQLNGQDDLVWYPTKKISADTWSVDIDCHRLNDSGIILAHVYAAGGVSVTSFEFQVSQDDLIPASYRYMDSRVAGMWSPSNWLLAVDTYNCFVGAYHWDNGAWNCWYRMTCSPGKPSTPTVKGTFSVGSRGYAFGSGYTCYYWTQFYNDYLFHSILYDQGTFNVQDGRLGQQLSHGCVRMDYYDAKWVHDTIPSGTTVLVY